MIYKLIALVVMVKAKIYFETCQFQSLHARSTLKLIRYLPMRNPNKIKLETNGCSLIKFISSSKNEGLESNKD